MGAFGRWKGPRIEEGVEVTEVEEVDGVSEGWEGWEAAVVISSTRETRG